MNEQIIRAIGEDVETHEAAVVSHETAIVRASKLGQRDPARANHLKPYRWKKGIPSPNAGGRPRALPISDRLRASLEMPLPDGDLRETLEMAVGKLPRNFKFGDAMALMAVLGAMGQMPDFRLDIMREIREAVEGKATQRVEVVDEPIPDDPEELRDKVMAGFVKVAIKRARMYNLHLPSLVDMADEAGVDLGIPREDKPKGDGKSK